MGDNMAKATEQTTENKKPTVEHKAFKSSSEVENFYRFIYENNLREETRKLLSYVLEKTRPKKKRRKRTTKKTLQ
jgi:hypothetical protein